MDKDDLRWRDVHFDDESQQDFERNANVVESNLWVKVEKYGKKISFLKDILALYNYFRDPYVKWYRKTIVVGALLYFISPMDAIPDLTPLVGYLDDLGVIAAVLKYMGSELIPYYNRG